MRRPTFPIYPRRPHKSGQARVKLAGRSVYLGVWGSEASRALYDRLRAEWAARVASGLPPAPERADAAVRTVGDLLALYWGHVQARCADGAGGLRQHADNVARSLRPVEVLFGTLPVGEFGPRALKAARAAILAGWHDPDEGPRRPTNRKGTNAAVHRVRAAWRWAVGEELVAEPLWRALLSVTALTEDDAGRPDPPRPRPPALADVLRTLPLLNPVVRAMAHVQLLTGARPSELYGLAPADVVRSGGVELDDGTPLCLEDGKPLDCSGVWVARRWRHKTRRLGAVRFLFFGPRAQEILRPFLEGRPADRPLFVPAEASAWSCAERRRNRVAPRRPCDDRRAARAAASRPGDRRPGASYTRHGYDRAVARAVARHNRRALDAGPCRPGDLVGAWSVYGLRRLCATLVRREFGIERARKVLGHRQVRTTEMYVAEDLGEAAQALARLG